MLKSGLSARLLHIHQCLSPPRLQGSQALQPLKQGRPTLQLSQSEAGCLDVEEEEGCLVVGEEEGCLDVGEEEGCLDVGEEEGCLDVGEEAGYLDAGEEEGLLKVALADSANAEACRGKMLSASMMV